MQFTCSLVHHDVLHTWGKFQHPAYKWKIQYLENWRGKVYLYFRMLSCDAK